MATMEELFDAGIAKLEVVSTNVYKLTRDRFDPDTGAKLDAPIVQEFSSKQLMDQLEDLKRQQEDLVTIQQRIKHELKVQKTN
jgi:hypothetical protein